MSRLEREVQKRILILDGAMATMIQDRNLSEEDFRTPHSAEVPQKGNNDLLNLTRPDLIQAIHESFLDAGADILETNTFNANPISQSDYAMESLVADMNQAGVDIARKAILSHIDHNPNTTPKFIAGSIGPTTKMLSISADVTDPGARSITFDELKAAYLIQVTSLVNAGVDALILETFIDTLNAKAALAAIHQVFSEKQINLPVMVSGTITDNSGRLLSGQTVDAFLVSISPFPLFSVGLNCALGAAELTPHIRTLAEESKFYVSAHPNAGLPNPFGKYDQTPSDMAALIQSFAEAGWLNIVGGCCGTTPEHIRAIADAVRHYPPRLNAKATKMGLKQNANRRPKPMSPLREFLMSPPPYKTKWTAQDPTMTTISLNEMIELIVEAKELANLDPIIQKFLLEKELFHGEQAMFLYANIYARMNVLRSEMPQD